MEKSTRACVSLFDQELQDFMRELRIVGKKLKEFEISSGNEMNEIILIESMNGIDSGAMEKTGMTCSVCLVVFESVESQRQHFKLDWHRFNLKQKLMDKPVLSEEAFEETISGEVSSISGSDSDDDFALESSPISSPSVNGLSKETGDGKSAPMGRQHPKLVFVNGSGDLLSVYRSVLYSVKDIPSTPESLLSLFTGLPTKRYWMILMTAGGHFAGAVFNGKDVLMHRTFHRYTVRAKRGTAQGTRDGQQGGKHPKSAGSSLRRYNEIALVQDVQDLLEAWSQHLARCDRIFLRAPVYNRSIFFGGKKPPFNKDDPRVRTIPFPTRRPTFNEVKRVHQELSSVHLLGKESGPPRQDLVKEISKPKTGDLPSSEDDQVRLWHEKNALETTGLELEDKTTLEETDFTLRGTSSSEDMGNVALTTKPNEISKKVKRKKTKGKKVEMADLLHSGEKLSSEQHLWNRLYCAIVSGNNQVICSLLGATIIGTKKENSQIGESLCQENGKETKSDGPSSLAPSGKTATNTIPTEKCLCVESETNALPLCQHCNSEIKLTSSEKNCQRPSPIEETGQTFFDIELANGYGGREGDESNSDAFSANCYENKRGIFSEDDSKRVEISHVLNERFGDGSDTLLHVASRSSRTDVVVMLLGIGADPAVKDEKGRPPYVVAGSKETRNEFRRFMASFPDRYDYVKAQIPSPLTPEMQSEKDRKNAEKKKAQKKAQKQRNKEQKTLQRKKEEEEKEKQAFQSLSEREKRAVAAEKRFAQQQAAKKAGNILSCAWCSTSLSGQVPFERLAYHYCSTACVKAHRLDMDAHPQR